MSEINFYEWSFVHNVAPKLWMKHRFCTNCCSSINTPTESTVNKSEITWTPSNNFQSAEKQRIPKLEDVVDRKTLFDDGCLF